MICAYDGRNGGKQSGWPLSGQQQITGELDRLAAELSAQPRSVPHQRRACTVMAGPQVNYLIGLTYPRGGTMWVSATDEPNSCYRGSNGQFTTSTAVASHDAAKAYSTGTWPARQPASCRLPGGGRYGQDTTMVPPGATSPTICTNASRVIHSGYRPLISALNTLPTHPSSATCIAHGHGVHYLLLFSYPNGLSAAVNVASNCTPPIDNHNLQANNTGPVLPIIQKLLTAH